jgi:hypothetical protein
MDGPTVLLMVVVAVIAASQLMQHVGDLILRPYVFWPVEGLLGVALVAVMLFPLGELPSQIRLGIRVFLSLFVIWRIVQNWMIRERARRRVQGIASKGSPPTTGTP